MESQEITIKLPPVTVVIPAYNEEKHLANTIRSVLDSGFPCELIVVDDGSKDKTLTIARSFEPKIKVLAQKKNRGKGAAMAWAIREAKGEIIVFLDAHLLGLKKSHFLFLVMPIVEGIAEVIIGNCEAPLVSLKTTLLPLWIISGQRAYRRNDLTPIAQQMESLGYGVETYLNNKLRDKKTLVTHLMGITHLLKNDHMTARQTAASYLKEARDIMKAVSGIENLNPQELTKLKNDIYSVFSQYANSGKRRATTYAKKLAKILQMEI
jgi:glycosyltransferase involved in cell wall biosynthesis